MEEPVESIVKERERIMSTGEGSPIWRKAHFLKPTFNSIKEPVFELPLDSLSSLHTPTDPKTWPFRVKFVGWRNPQVGWKNWVQKMASLHLSTWKKAGIHEPIMNSTLEIKRNDLLIFGLVEKWSNETKTFIFPWGEATITLEDVTVSWGYSMLGSPVNSSLESRELEEIEEKLENARKGILRTKSKKACQSSWMNKFMEDGGIEFEHEAFLAFWLSRFVFPTTFDVISSIVFPIAIRLARGTKIALAPAVLAALYRDLGILKHGINASAMGNSENVDYADAVTLRASFQLVQIWAWERFLQLQPRNPNAIKDGESRLARWQNLKFKVENVRLVLDSAREAFDWRPYSKFVENWDSCFAKLYGENGLWLSVGLCLDEELESFAKCLMVSELIGLNCVEWYYPNRVAMQFGFDQDIPGYPPVTQNAGGRPFNELKMYIPPGSFQGSVTVRYLKWWERSMNRSKGRHTSNSNDVQVKRSSKGLKRTKECNVSEGSLKRMKVAIAFPQENSDESVNSLEDLWTLDEIFKLSSEQENSDESVNSLEDVRTLSETFKLSSKQDDLENGQELSDSLAMQKELNNSPFPPGFPPKHNAMEASNQEKMRKLKDLNNSPFPPGFPPKPIAMEESIPIREEELTFPEEFKSSGDRVGLDIGQDRDGARTGGESRSLSSKNDGGDWTFQSDPKCLELELRVERLQRIMSRLKPAMLARHSCSHP
ncbi:uncharacterized protein LOC119990232 [Tripterygium wilfordii]|uniref:uncharacterized protein LOC119990232 n=1 Tax=Tripterygium wilfordii TaxID=458696 RepID=UPI0018F83B15|nr:uncharacterized protein LOC119990232 [Tripterygium wilfordii]